MNPAKRLVPVVELLLVFPKRLVVPVVPAVPVPVVVLPNNPVPVPDAEGAAAGVVLAPPKRLVVPAAGAVVAGLLPNKLNPPVAGAAAWDDGCWAVELKPPKRDVDVDAAGAGVAAGAPKENAIVLWTGDWGTR